MSETPQSKSLKVLAPASVYVVIRLLSQGVVLGASLLLARMLPIEAFAAIGTSFLIQAMITPLSGFALHGGLERMFFSYDPEQRRNKIFTVYLASLAINTLICLVAFVLLSSVLRLQFISDRDMALTLTSTLLMSVQYVPIVAMRCDGELRSFALLQMVFVVVTQAAILLAVLIRRDVDAFFYGSLAGSLVGFLIWGGWLWRRAGFARLVPIREETAYSLPSVPIGILESAQQAVDRYILQLAVPGPQFASYGLALRFASPVSTIAQGTKSALYPILYRLRDEQKIQAVLSDTTNMSIGMFGVLVNLIVVLMAFIVAFFLSEEFRQVYPIFLVVIFGVFVRVQEVFLGVGADVTMRQDKKLYTLLPVMLTQIAVSIGLTTTFGLWGAACAFALNGVIRSLAMAILGQKVLPRRLALMEYSIVVFSTAMPLAIYFYLAAVAGRVVGPELLLSLLPALVLAQIVRTNLRRASLSSLQPDPGGDRSTMP